MNWKAYMDDMKNDIRALNRTIPETTRAFATLGKSVKESEVLPFKTKEFIALGIAVSQGCEPCIGFHIEALVRIGASREEVADALAMALQMGGGPALMYAAKALAAYDQMKADKEK